MKIQNIIRKITIAVLSAAMMLAPIVNIKAASTDVVDTSKTGSITIHKYDMTSAKQAGVNTSQFTPTGKQDAAAEAALENMRSKVWNLVTCELEMLNSRVRMERSR